MESRPEQRKSSRRREFLKKGLGGGAAAGMVALGLTKQTRADGDDLYGKRPFCPPANWKEWARKNFKGVENETMPSFNPDFTRLSERAIRHDVRMAVRHGFNSTLCAAESGLSFREARRLTAVAAHEGMGKIHVGSSVVFDSFDQCFAMVSHAKIVGCTHVLLGYPPSFNPKSVTEIHDITSQLCKTADIGIVLYPKFDFMNVNPLDVVDALDDIADIPNVIGAKIFDGPFLDQCFRRFGDRLLLSSPNPFTIIKNAGEYRQQWIGAGPYEVFQSPNRPYFVTMMNSILQGNFGKASGIFEMLQPVMESFMSRHGVAAMLGTYNWPEHKYYQFLSGANGGYTRQPVMKISKETMDTIKKDYLSIGIEPIGPDDHFYLGRVNS
ncbi:MAG: hypothetical protein GF344_17255 [Chitinivibrionales bacterium]|nr:hypothetical protein [Chitinivibrionales bacterium]MBD3358419.1 hypothetical protein [Chitinivibrionales bacterium]